METIATIILPVFGLIGLGYAARKLNYFAESVGVGLSAFVFGAAIPALIFRALAEGQAAQASPYALWAAYFGGVIASWAPASFVVTYVLKQGWRKGVSAGITAGFSNTVLLGLPLIYTAVGEAGAVPLSLIVSIHLPVLLLAGTLLMEAAPEGEKPRFMDVLKSTTKSLATNPIIIAIVLGAAWGFSGFPLPALLKTLLDSLSASAIPCALFAMGMELARYGVFGELRAASATIVAKLLAQPLVAFLLAYHVFDLPPSWTATATLLAAAPTGVNAYLFATRYDSGIALASSSVALSTACSVVTMSLWLGFLGL